MQRCILAYYELKKTDSKMGQRNKILRISVHSALNDNHRSSCLSEWDIAHDHVAKKVAHVSCLSGLTPSLLQSPLDTRPF